MIDDFRFISLRIPWTIKKGAAHGRPLGIVLAEVKRF
jgi:hypothetical protein